MPEVSLDFPRAWFEFVDPADTDQVIRADLTWLTSRWSCIFGRGCQGIYADRPEAGCCALGAHFSSKKDQKRVAAWVAKLDGSLWQKIDKAKKRGWTQKEDDGTKTRVVGSGGCIFNNDRDFPGGFGCALHHLAAREGVSFIETKPDVCWQLPIRRHYDRQKHEDGTDRLVIVIGEYDRRGWGAGGHDLDWYCSGNTEAHVGTVPVYQSSRDELLALLGPQAYAVLEAACDARMAAMSGPGSAAGFAPHPADPQ